MKDATNTNLIQDSGLKGKGTYMAGEAHMLASTTEKSPSMFFSGL